MSVRKIQMLDGLVSTHCKSSYMHCNRDKLLWGKSGREKKRQQEMGKSERQCVAEQGFWH
jgi:hypothetical protein